MKSVACERMVVKPLDFIIKGRRGLVLPAMKFRGPQYFRINYGSEYLPPDLGREFALVLEALERFVHKEPCGELRVRLWISGTGKRAGRPEVVAVRFGIIFGYKFGYTRQFGLFTLAYAKLR